jgi:hypothetical protein
LNDTFSLPDTALKTRTGHETSDSLRCPFQVERGAMVSTSFALFAI